MCHLKEGNFCGNNYRTTLANTLSAMALACMAVSSVNTD